MRSEKHEDDSSIQVVILGLGLGELERLAHPGEGYPDLCDRLTRELASTIAATGLSRFICPLDDDRSGETLSVSLAFELGSLRGRFAEWLEKGRMPWELLQWGVASDFWEPKEVERIRSQLSIPQER